MGSIVIFPSDPSDVKAALLAFESAVRSYPRQPGPDGTRALKVALSRPGDSLASRIDAELRALLHADTLRALGL
jgi:hypothetical protein